MKHRLLILCALPALAACDRGFDHPVTSNGNTLSAPVDCTATPGDDICTMEVEPIDLPLNAETEE